MRLLERQDVLDRLRGFLADVVAGEGRLVLIGGEAGVGKSVLIHDFTDSVRDHAEVMVGACDPLSTPTPLGPLLDIAPSLSEPLAELLNSGTQRAQVFEALRTALGTNKPTVLVFEDVHWADEATLDLLRFLGRRLASLGALVVATYRDDEVGPTHPLRIVFGDLATFSCVRRLHLTPLSEAAVRELAYATDIDPSELYRQTAGNPFFVTEVLASGTHEVPPNVRDAVLARVARLPPCGREVLHAAAVIGRRSEAWLLEAVSGSPEGGIEACLHAGVLHAEGTSYTFRHELSRAAILDTVPPARRLELHSRTLQALRRNSPGPDDWARLAHHAEAANDAQAVLAFAPIAAERASLLKAHREAAAQYARALRFADDLAPAEHAHLLEARAYECYLTEQMEAAIAARHAALEIRRDAGDLPRVSENLRWLSRLWWVAGRNADAHTAAAEALRVLEGLPPCAELAWAYANRAQLSMLANDWAGAREWGKRAIALAEQLGNAEVLTHALNSVGTARATYGDARGFKEMERSLSVALENGLEEHAGRAYSNLGSVSARQYRLDVAETYLEAGLAYAADHDVDVAGVYMLGWQACLLMRRGRWNEATEVAAQLLRRTPLSTISRIVGLTVVGTLRARRGDPDVMTALDEALDLACPTGEVQRLGPLFAARAEAAWLAGDLAGARTAARAGFDIAERAHEPWLLAELAYWRWQLGDLRTVPKQALGPYALQVAGRWREARSAWLSAGCPYEAALASIGGDDAAVRDAFRTFTELGAARTMNMVMRMLREKNSRVPRGPRPATRRNIAGLTQREREILDLLAEGLRNVEIGERLSVSPRTVEHHVSAVLAKLGARSRVEAVAWARGIQRVPQSITQEVEGKYRYQHG